MTEPLPRAYHIVDEGALHKYRTEIPNTVIRGQRGRGLSVYAKWLYVYLKSVAGDTGECWQSTTTLAEGAGISRAQAGKAKNELARHHLITITDGQRKNRDAQRIHIADIWLSNMQEFMNRWCLYQRRQENAEELEETPINNSGVSGRDSGVSGRDSGVSVVAQKKISLRRSQEEEDLAPLSINGTVQTENSAQSPSAAKAYSPGFERFWQAYPVKKGKGNAWAVWRRLHLDPLTDRICASVAEHQQHDGDWAKNYIKHPATYLTGRCWEDEFPTASAAPQPQRRGLVL